MLALCALVHLNPKTDTFLAISSAPFLQGTTFAARNSDTTRRNEGGETPVAKLAGRTLDAITKTDREDYRMGEGEGVGGCRGR